MLTIVAAAGTGAGAAQSDKGLGTLPLQVEVDIHYPPVTCPDGTPGSFECLTRTGEQPAGLHRARGV